MRKSGVKMIFPNRTYQEFDFALGSDFTFVESVDWVDALKAEPSPARRGFWIDEELADCTGYSVSQLNKIRTIGAAHGYKAKKPGGGYKRVWVRPEAFRIFAALEIARLTNMNVELAALTIRCLDQFARNYGEKLDIFHSIAELARKPETLDRIPDTTFQLCVFNDVSLFIWQKDLCPEFHTGHLAIFAEIESRQPPKLNVIDPKYTEGFIEHFYGQSTVNSVALPPNIHSPTSKIEIDLPKIIYPMVKGAFDSE